jgi:hypothetical protein
VTTAGVLANGTYRLAASPNCGNFQVDGASLVVQGPSATITQGPNTNGEPVPGSVSTQAGRFHVHVANGTVVVIDLTGGVNVAGILTGSGQSNGVNPSGQTGWVCAFSFTATPAGAASPGVPMQTTTGGEFLSPTRNISCEINHQRSGVPDGVYCQTFSPPQSVKMSPDGSFTTCTGSNCVGNPGIGTPILAYGQTTGVGPFSCLSAESGVTCTASGRGFEISRSGITPSP